MDVGGRDPRLPAPPLPAASACCLLPAPSVAAPAATACLHLARHEANELLEVDGAVAVLVHLQVGTSCRAELVTRLGSRRDSAGCSLTVHPPHASIPSKLQLGQQPECQRRRSHPGARSRSAPTSLIMSCSSASVGFWPSDRITVPSSLVVMVPCRHTAAAAQACSNRTAGGGTATAAASEGGGARRPPGLPARRLARVLAIPPVCPKLLQRLLSNPPSCWGRAPRHSRRLRQGAAGGAISRADRPQATSTHQASVGHLTQHPRPLTAAGAAPAHHPCLRGAVGRAAGSATGRGQPRQRRSPSNFIPRCSPKRENASRNSATISSLSCCAILGCGRGKSFETCEGALGQALGWQWTRGRGCRGCKTLGLPRPREIRRRQAGQRQQREPAGKDAVGWLWQLGLRTSSLWTRRGRC